MKRQPERENDNPNRTWKKRWKSRRRAIRLVLEPLEARRLLAGLNVSVFVDQDGSRSVGAADTAAVRRVVFLDLDNNGRQDSSDPVAFTNERGMATFANLIPGDYGVGIAAGNSLQSQSFPIRVEELGKNIGPAASTLIASDDLSRVWAFDGAGRGQLVSESAEPTKIQLGGTIVTSVNVGDEAWLITRSENGRSGSKLTQFNLSTGRQTSIEIRGLNGRAIETLVKVGTEVVAKLNGSRGIELAKLSLVAGVPTIGAGTAFPNLVTVSGAANQLAIIEYQNFATIQMQPQATKLSVLGLNDFSIQATTVLPQSADEIAISADGRLVFAAFTTGGVVVLNNNAELSSAATLAEATGPLLTQSKDGRFVTGNSADSLEFVVWDTSSWQPSGRTRVTASDRTLLTAPIPVSQVILANTGDRLIATGMAGTVASQLAQATTAQVSVPREGFASVQLGVRVKGENRIPSSAPVAATSLEDNAVSGQLRTQVTDADHDRLWFRILSSPSHGRLQVSPTGEWSYQPSENFNGTDRAIVRVFDGLASSDLALVLNVTPVNDPPKEIRVELPMVAENVIAKEAGEGLGFVTVFDVDPGSRYQFSVSDPRFQVRNGQIYLVPGEKLDFESESSIKLEITATEDAVSGYQVSTFATLSISDVNEPPTAVRILNRSVTENSPGATVGQVRVDDPDASDRFVYAVSDPRFFVEGGLLRLKPGVDLDFEKANSISLTIAVSDSGGQTFTQSISLTVMDQNDVPTSIDVQLRPLEEATEGAVVGTISVNDQDKQAYEYTVSDPRFEVVNGELKLKEGETVDKTVDTGLSLTVTAVSIVGSDTISNTFGVAVVAKKSPFQNPAESRDVNGDGDVTPLDALILINHINSNGAGPLANTPRGGSGEGQIWLDVNGDGIISPLDVLIIINALNRRRLVAQSTERAEGEADPSFANDGIASPFEAAVMTQVGAGMDPSPLSADEAAENYRAIVARRDAGIGSACPAIESLSDSEIEQELENLLDQLTRERLGIFGA